MKWTSRGRSHRVDVYHWGKKRREKIWRTSFRIRTKDQIVTDWWGNKQTTPILCTILVLSSIIIFFKLVFSVCFFHRDAAGVFIMWCIWMYTQAWSSSSTETKRDRCISPRPFWPFTLGPVACPLFHQQLVLFRLLDILVGFTSRSGLVLNSF